MQNHIDKQTKKIYISSKKYLNPDMSYEPIALNLKIIFCKLNLTENMINLNFDLKYKRNE